MPLRSSIAVAVAQALVAVPFLPLAWELSYATDVAIKRKKKKKEFVELTNEREIISK